MGPAIPLSIGTVIEATVTASDPKCYPMWDSNAGCLWFSVVTSESGDLAVTLRAARPSGEVDLFLRIGETLTWIAQGSDGASRGSVPVVAGSEIDILVIAYGFPEPFFLETALR
jgi:hypothetical protein